MKIWWGRAVILDDPVLLDEGHVARLTSVSAVGSAPHFSLIAKTP